MLLKMKSSRTMFRMASGSLALFAVLGMPRLASMMSEDVLDAARGALLGVTLGLYFLFFRLQRKAGA